MIRYKVSLQVQIGIRNLRLSYQGTKNVAIYAFFSGKFQNVRKYACVKDLTNIMSDDISEAWTDCSTIYGKSLDKLQNIAP